MELDSEHQELSSECMIFSTAPTQSHGCSPGQPLPTQSPRRHIGRTHDDWVEQRLGSRCFTLCQLSFLQVQNTGPCSSLLHPLPATLTQTLSTLFWYLCNYMFNFLNIISNTVNNNNMGGVRVTLPWPLIYSANCRHTMKHKYNLITK